VVIVIARDLIIVGGLLVVNFWVMDVRTRIKPTFASKVNTTVQIGFILLVLAARGGWLTLPVLMETALWATAALPAYTGVDYVLRGMAQIPSDGESQ